MSKRQGLNENLVALNEVVYGLRDKIDDIEKKLDGFLPIVTKSQTDLVWVKGLVWKITGGLVAIISYLAIHSFTGK